MNYNRIFNVNFSKLAVLLTPIFWRKAIFMNFIYCFIEPIKVIHNEFKVFRKNSIYKIVHNGQVMILEKVLNDAFDNTLRRIYITDSLIKDPLYIYSTPEQKPVYLGSEFLYDFSVFNDIGTDFNVIFPISLKPVTAFDLLNSENRIKALINYYKLASKRYKIQWI